MVELLLVARARRGARHLMRLSWRLLHKRRLARLGQTRPPADQLERRRRARPPEAATRRLERFRHRLTPPPNRRIHMLWLRTATRGPVGRCSSAVNGRPTRRGVRNSRKKGRAHARERRKLRVALTGHVDAIESVRGDVLEDRVVIPSDLECDRARYRQYRAIVDGDRTHQSVCRPGLRAASE